MLIDRVNNLKQELQKQKLDGFLISGVEQIAYFTGYDNFSKEEREAFLLITKSGQYILTDGRYTTAIASQVKYFDLLEISSENSLRDLLKKINEKHQVSVLGADFKDLTHHEYKQFKKVFKTIKHAKLHSLRAIKGKEEIKEIEKACNLGDGAFEFILPKIKEGISEKELARQIEVFVKSNGASLSFETIVAFGANSAVPHHQTSDNRLEISDKFLLLDFGTKVNGYCSDMTRTIFFGNPSKEQEKIYETVLHAQEKAAEYIAKKLKSNQVVKASQADKIARDYIISKGYDSIPHSLGHGTGLQVHEHPSLSPKSKDILKEGMVFSIEPGIYIPGYGGVRIEDLYVIEAKKICQLTKSPKNLTII